MVEAEWWKYFGNVRAAAAALVKSLITITLDLAVGNANIQTFPVLETQNVYLDDERSLILASVLTGLYHDANLVQHPAFLVLEQQNA